MSQRTRFVCYQPKTILNKGKRADHWLPDIGLVHRTMGIKGLMSLPNVSPGIAQEIETLLRTE